MALISCPECAHDVSDQAAICLHCGFPIREAILPAESELISVSPRLFGGNWFVTLFALLLCLIAVGIPWLLWEWVSVRTTRLVISTRRSIVREGILDKRTNEVRHIDIRNVRVSQGWVQRMFGVGTLEISSAGQSGVEIRVRGLPNPERIAKLIWDHR